MGWDVAELAERADLPESAVADAELGHRLYMSELHSIALALYVERRLTMTYEELECDLRLLVTAAIHQGQVQEQEQWLPYQRIKATNELVQMALALIRAWDNGREWHLYGDNPS